MKYWLASNIEKNAFNGNLIKEIESKNRSVILLLRENKERFNKVNNNEKKKSGK